MLPHRRWFLSAGAALTASSLASCKIVAIGDDPGSTAVFDPVGYAQGLWHTQALPHFTASAKPIGEVVAAVHQDLASAGATYGYRPATEGSPWIFVVEGGGTVIRKNAQSRAGTMTVALEGTDPPLQFDVQIGPVVRGNAVRDSLPFVSFKDFTNQLEFADVGKALTARAMEEVAAQVAVTEPGQRIALIGVVSLNSKADKLIVTPVSLKPAP